MKATLNLENDYGFVLDMDISDKENPSVTVYDFEGNEISGGGGSDFDFVKVEVSNVVNLSFTLNINWDDLYNLIKQGKYVYFTLTDEQVETANLIDILRPNIKYVCVGIHEPEDEFYETAWDAWGILGPYEMNEIFVLSDGIKNPIGFDYA